MSDQSQRIRITLRWIQILDKLEPFFKEKGEFRFTAKVTTGADGSLGQESRFPEDGYYSISDHPAWNKLGMDRVIYEGEASDRLVVELIGEEIDLTSGNDLLDNYRREFTGPPSTWAGRHCPGDEGSDDPENMSNWRVCYEIALL